MSLRSMLQEYIQEREASEEILRRGEERYRVLVDNLTTIVFQVDRELRWTFLNPAWETVTGRLPAESVGQFATLLMVDGDGAECEALDMPFFLEPVGYDVSGADVKGFEYARIKPEIVLRTTVSWP